MRPSVSSVKVNRYKPESFSYDDDLLSAEEPMEIRLVSGADEERAEHSISVTMRTPGHDFELALGFLFTEGIIKSMNDVSAIRYCNTRKPEEAENVVRVELAPEVDADILRLKRHFYTSSSCGVCGKTSLEAVNAMIPSFEKEKTSNAITLNASLVCSLPAKLQEQQTIFNHTGGLHAAALFDTDGNLVLLREDIGRHNALDKIIGAALAEKNISLTDKCLLLSGRSGFELIQKSAMAGIPVVAAVGAPSGLSVRLAEQAGITLIGFLRNDKFNIYCGKERISI